MDIPQIFRIPRIVYCDFSNRHNLLKTYSLTGSITFRVSKW
jgi:hypothetical protein